MGYAELDLAMGNTTCALAEGISSPTAWSQGQGHLLLCAGPCCPVLRQVGADPGLSTSCALSPLPTGSSWGL